MTTEPAPKSAKDELIEIIKTVGYALLIALVLRVIFFQPFTIPSESMEPALLKGDYIIVSKYDYGWSAHSLPFSPPIFHGRIMNKPPARGDVVVFHLPRDKSIPYIKRLIGLPGDRIKVIGGQVFVNGKAIPRKPVGMTEDPGDPGVQVMQYAESKPNGRTYVTFDRAQDHEGDDTEVYVVPEGHYFMMGDNRDNSLDSRWPQEIGVGYVPAENLVGKARFIMLSWKGGASIFKPWTWVMRFDASRAFHRLD
ncbi:signal peptidase I [Phenylobacterium sp.]|uniref:signal peptidase I n=1 Tax=Phenylobacterium sp. TaxID=1871053 RepID=UPI0030F3A586